MKLKTNFRVLCAILLGIALFAPGVGSAQQVRPAATSNHAVKITTGLTYQLIRAAGERVSITIQNNQASGTDICYLVIGTNQIVAGTTTTSSNITIDGNTLTAAQASIVLSPGQAYTRYYPFIPSDAIYGTCATTADSLYVDTQ